MQPVLNLQSGAKQSQTPPLAHPFGEKDNSDEKWQIAMRSTNKKKPAPKPDVPLWNHFDFLQTEKERETVAGTLFELNKAARPVADQLQQLRKIDR